MVGSALLKNGGKGLIKRVGSGVGCSRTVGGGETNSYVFKEGEWNPTIECLQNRYYICFEFLTEEDNKNE